MEINRVIIHELKKEAQSKKASLPDPSTKPCEIDENTEFLITKLDENYWDLDITYARFKTSDDINTKAGKDKNDDKSKGTKKKYVNEFKVEMDKYYEKETDKSFTDFTTKVMQYLERDIGNVWFAKGGFFVFADYQSSDHEKYLGVFLIRHTDALFLRKEKGDETFIVNPTIRIDFEKMAMACKIDKKKFESKKGRYLSFVSGKNEALSKYFIDWIAAGDLKNNTIDTVQFLNLLEDIELPEGKDRDQLKQDVYNEVIKDSEKMTNLRTLAKKFYGDEKVFVDYANRKGIEIDSEFKPDKRKLRKSVVIRAFAEEIDGQAAAIEIIFNAVFFGSKVRLNDENPNLIIIDSRELADKIRELMGLN